MEGLLSQIKMKNQDEIEITTVRQLKGAGLFKTLVGSVDIIPDPTIENGYKYTIGYQVFISPTNYSDIKGLKSAKYAMTALSYLTELSTKLS